ncbi:MAG: hypothetical protein IPH66_00335 [Crocinitomicaceae bacterium]|nr:hypothetical protein [Crocinitomicaceae bacterium]
MKFYYSILKISPNTSSGDSFSIGLLAFDKNEAVIHFSENRKLLAKKLVEPSLIDFFCKQLVQKVNELNKIHQRDLKTLFKKEYVFDESYLDYLSNYSSGLLQLSKSNVFKGLMNEDNLTFLFESLIEKTKIKKQTHKKKSAIMEIVEEKLIERVKDKVHTHVKLDSSVLNTLHYSFDMDCIGKNGVFVGARTLDFTNSHLTLDNTISHYINLITLLTLEHNKKISENKFYVIGEEPMEIDSKEHEIWDSIQGNPLFSVIHPEQSELVAVQIEKSKAKKFI